MECFPNEILEETLSTLSFWHEFQFVLLLWKGSFVSYFLSPLLTRLAKLLAAPPLLPPSHSLKNSIVRLTWQNKHFTLPNFNILEFSILNDFQSHSTFMLIEEFFCWLVMIIWSGVGSSYYHHCVIRGWKEWDWNIWMEEKNGGQRESRVSVGREWHEIRWWLNVYALTLKKTEITNWWLK